MTTQTNPQAIPAEAQQYRDDSVALQYAQRMFDRQRQLLPPAGFEVDWVDQPSHHKVYLSATKLSLPRPFVTIPDVRLNEGYETARMAQHSPDVMPPLDVVASTLACGAITNRHVALNWNDDANRKQRPIFADWSRATASGGGMYPTESYLVVGPDGPLPIGTYHYDTAHHMLNLITATDQTPYMTQATGVSARLYLIAAARLWKNSFKYNSFCYHVVTQDTGALLASWRLVLGTAGFPVQPRFWFDQSLVANVIGVDGSQEPPFVVIPFGPATKPMSPPETTLKTHGITATAPQPWERSSRPRTFPLVDHVNAATWISTTHCTTPAEDARSLTPAPVTADRCVSGPIALPQTQWDRQLTIQDSLARRHSAFGTLMSHPRVQLDQLAGVLQMVAAASSMPTDLTGSDRSPWIRAWVIAAHVAGLPAGGYAYDPGQHTLNQVRAGTLDDLQTRYPLQNYNTAEVGATLVLTGRLTGLVAAYGDPGYRFLSLETGQAAQTAYVAATATGLGVGAVLGVDNVTINDWLGLGTDEQTMLCVFLGSERSAAGYDHHLPDRAPPQTHTTAPSMEGQS